jgi:hypothetical protein
MTIIGASPGQMRLLHVKAKQAGESHEHIRDRAATEFGIESLTELTMEQARQLISIYDDLINPPEPVVATVSGRGMFAGLPKRVAPKAAPAPVQPVVRVSVAPIIPPAPPPKPRTVHNFDPHLKIRRDDGLDQIPW